MILGPVRPFGIKKTHRGSPTAGQTDVPDSVPISTGNAYPTRRLLSVRKILTGKPGLAQPIRMTTI
jgi:hypothetical protein